MLYRKKTITLYDRYIIINIISESQKGAKVTQKYPQYNTIIYIIIIIIINIILVKKRVRLRQRLSSRFKSTYIITKWTALFYLLP